MVVVPESTRKTDGASSWGAEFSVRKMQQHKQSMPRQLETHNRCIFTFHSLPECIHYVNSLHTKEHRRDLYVQIRNPVAYRMGKLVS